MKNITVLLADDHTVVREGLRSLLQAEPDLEVVGEASDGREALAMARALKPQVVVMDVAMANLNGLEATLLIRRALPETRVLVLSAYGDDAYVDRALLLGATGYLLKQTSSRVLAEAVREIARGRVYLGTHLSKIARVRKASSPMTVVTELTSREREVVQLIAEGKANKQIASDLAISVKTVEKHRQHLMDKLGIHDTAGLTRHAIAEGIIEGGGRLGVRAETAA